jgi:hypothetical protein
MRLPLELREQIYELVLCQSDPTTFRTQYGNYLTLGYFPLDFTRYHLQKPVKSQAFLPPLLYVSPQLRSEGLSIFLRMNTICLEADYHVDMFLIWLRDVDLFSSVRSLDLPFSNHSHLGRSAQQLLEQCPKLKHLDMTFSKEKIAETRKVTGKFLRRCRPVDRHVKFDDDVAIPMDGYFLESNWRQKLERVRNLPSLRTLTLISHGLLEGHKWSDAYAKEDLAKLKEWFDQGFGGSVEVRTELTVGYRSEKQGIQGQQSTCEGATDSALYMRTYSPAP